MTNFNEHRIRIKDVAKENGVQLLNSNPVFDKPIAWKEYLVFMENFNNNLKLLWK